MVLRLVGAFGASLMMFQLAFAGELACPQPDVERAPVHRQADPAAAHHHGHEDANAGTPTDHAPADHGPGDHGTMPPCCQAMAACSSAFALQSANSTFVAASPHATRLVLAASLRVTRVEAPDPPPPKA